MIESIMYMGIGLLSGCLIGVAIMPLVHGRAVRLTIRQLEAALPQSIEEIQADKDLLRAEFAMSTRRLEMSVEHLTNKIATQLAELGKKNDVINRLKIQRDALKVEVIALKTQFDALKRPPAGADKEVKSEAYVASIVRRFPRRMYH
jgi:uncharacterized membrane-anchored protein YhcB (DUF1043 family)